MQYNRHRANDLFPRVDSFYFFYPPTIYRIHPINAFHRDISLLHFFFLYFSIVNSYPKKISPKYNFLSIIHVAQIIPIYSCVIQRGLREINISYEAALLTGLTDYHLLSRSTIGRRDNVKYNRFEEIREI